MPSTISEHLQSILEYYPEISQRPFGMDRKLWSFFDGITEKLRTSSQISRFKTLRLKWSAGQGRWADVPWIAILDYRETESIQKGVYCVFLFRQDMSGVYLTLNQGTTEIKKEMGVGGLEVLKRRAVEIRGRCQRLTVSGFRLDDSIDLRADPGRGTDYEAATIAYRLYEKGNIPEDTSLLADLQSLLESYVALIDTNPGSKVGPTGPISHDCSMVAETFSKQTRECGLVFSMDLSARLVASSLSKRFLLLSGNSGSGKTKSAQAFARWIVEESTNWYAVVPVGADWTGNENILGYPNGLDDKNYVSRPALALILHAQAHENLPHFLILDEMNLSHVERYFADLLSAIESEEPLVLYDGDMTKQETWRKSGPNSSVPPVIEKLPDNLFIIGTVNVDETTYMFSPKVLDRANVIEFRVEPDEFAAFLASPRAPDLDSLDGKGSHFGEAFVAAARNRDIGVPASVKQAYESEMLLFFNLLRKHNAEFGYRVGYESARFVHFYKLLGGYGDGNNDWFNAAMDAVIVQKLLPKLHGSRSKLEGLLWALAWACGFEKKDRDSLSFEAQLEQASAASDDKYNPEKVWEELAKEKPADPSKAARYPLSYDKVMRMWRKLVRDQFVTFAEA